MKTGPSRRKGWKRLKSKFHAQRQNKSYKTSQAAVTNENETIPVESTHRLLLSSLKYWEVERDLIEERVAAFNR